MRLHNTIRAMDSTPYTKQDRYFFMVIAVAILIFVSLFAERCYKAKPKQEQDPVHSDTIKIYDTVTHPVYFNHLQMVVKYRHDTFYKTLTVAQLDTIADRYVDTMHFSADVVDSIEMINVAGDIIHDSVHHLSAHYRLLRPITTHITTTITKQPVKVQYGLTGTLNVGQTVTAGINGQVIKSNHIFQLGISTNKSFTIGYGIKF